MELDLKTILEKLYNNVKSSIDSKYIFYIEFLLNVCNAECLFNTKIANFNDIIKNLNNALALYVKAQILLKSINSCIQQTQLNSFFQLKYCELRCEQIKNFLHLLFATMSYQTIPAPKFFYATSDTISKYGRIGSQMKNMLSEAQKMNLKYKNFLKECFDADENTINILKTCKLQNYLVIMMISQLNGTFKSVQ